jgi:hypothetical protein
MPIPAPNIMENHEKPSNSGASPDLPSISLTVRGHSAKAKQVAIKNATAYTYQGPVLASLVDRIAPSVEPQTTARMISRTMTIFSPRVT